MSLLGEFQMRKHQITYVPADATRAAHAVQYLEEIRCELEDDLPSVIAFLQEKLMHFQQPSMCNGMYVCDRDDSSRGDRHVVTKRLVSFSRLYIDWNVMEWDNSSTPVLMGVRNLLPDEEVALQKLKEVERNQRNQRKLEEFERLKRELGIG
jgi:hypothetical protein